MTCTWPNGTCQSYQQHHMAEDPWGRVWMHCEEGLTMTKASMARFMMFCLANKVEFGSIDAFGPDIRGCQVIAAIRIHPSLIEDFERETGGKLRKPPRAVLS
ncbi:MAG: hypothetical protein MJH10_10125 [Epibacterium sp.]|nr:hypothetical protein [Epibacterium sp.]NQX73894.1 hypothetical protein [Epibacterium sp.]